MSNLKIVVMIKVTVVAFSKEKDFICVTYPYSGDERLLPTTWIRVTDKSLFDIGEELEVPRGWVE